MDKRQTWHRNSRAQYRGMAVNSCQKYDTTAIEIATFYLQNHATVVYKVMKYIKYYLN